MTIAFQKRRTDRERHERRVEASHHQGEAVTSWKGSSGGDMEEFMSDCNWEMGQIKNGNRGIIWVHQNDCGYSFLGIKNI